MIKRKKIQLIYIYIAMPQQNIAVTVIAELHITIADAVEFCVTLFCELTSINLIKRLNKYFPFCNLIISLAYFLYKILAAVRGRFHG